MAKSLTTILTTTGLLAVAMAFSPGCNREPTQFSQEELQAQAQKDLQKGEVTILYQGEHGNKAANIQEEVFKELLTTSKTRDKEVTLIESGRPAKARVNSEELSRIVSNFSSNVYSQPAKDPSSQKQEKAGKSKIITRDQTIKLNEHEVLVYYNEGTERRCAVVNELNFDSLKRERDKTQLIEVTKKGENTDINKQAFGQLVQKTMTIGNSEKEKELIARPENKIRTITIFGRTSEWDYTDIDLENNIANRRGPGYFWEAATTNLDAIIATNFYSSAACRIGKSQIIPVNEPPAIDNAVALEQGKIFRVRTQENNLYELYVREMTTVGKDRTIQLDIHLLKQGPKITIENVKSPEFYKTKTTTLNRFFGINGSRGVYLNLETGKAEENYPAINYQSDHKRLHKEGFDWWIDPVKMVRVNLDGNGGDFSGRGIKMSIGEKFRYTTSSGNIFQIEVLPSDTNSGCTLKYKCIHP